MARGTATVLFTDLVGSTELSVAHGERYEDARRAHDALLRGAIAAHGGQVIKGMGDGVMGTFDVVSDGVAAARAAQAAVHRLNHRLHGLALSIRVGMSVGDVSFEDGDCYGEPVVQAARLCGVCQGDQILATSVVQLLAGGPRAEGYTDLGQMLLKGLPDPVDVVQVEWDRPVASATPLPTRLSSAPPSFVGRRSELEELHRAFTDVNAGVGRRVVLVSGEPGIGKTTMVGQAARLWFDAGATVAMGRCEEDVRAPYRPFIDALDHLVASAPDDLLRAHVDRHGGRLVALSPALGQRVAAEPPAPSGDLETDRFLLFAAAGDLLAALGERTPIVLVLDDLHWADAGTTSLLRSLATAPEAARVLVIGTVRSDELTGEHPMGQALAAFRRVDAVSRMDLTGLASSDIVELVELWTGSDGGASGAQLAEDLVAETGGNAFFVLEVMRHLEETGDLAQLATSPRPRTLVPESVREVLGERIARLGSTADAVLGTAAVIGSEFTLPLLAEVTGLPDDKLLGILGEAAAAALVHELADAPGRFVFRHALVQQAILLNLGATREASLHRRVAEVLEVRVGDGGVALAELAHHWLQATNVSDSGRARDWARQAGDAALAALAPGDGVAFFRQALLLHDQLRDDDVATRIDLLIKLGTAERESGDPEHRDTLLKACRLARRLEDHDRLAAAALANNGGTFSQFQGVDGERVAMLEAAVAVITDPVRRALLLGTLANELTYSGDFDHRKGLADEALRVARDTGDQALLLQVSNLVFYALWVPETLDDRLVMTDESLDLVRVIEDPLPRFWAATANYLNLTQAGKVLQADVLLDDLDALADHLAQPGLLWRARHTRATRLLLAGDPDAAQPLVEEAREHGTRAGEPEALVYYKSQQLCLDWQRGSLADLAAVIKGTSPRPPNALASLCLIFAEGGRVDDATASLDSVADGLLRDLPHDPAYVACVALFSEAAMRLRHAPSAVELHRRILPMGDQIGFDGVMTIGSLQHHLGGLASVLGRHDEAVERLDRSAAVHDELGARFFRAQDHVELGAALLARQGVGDHERARAELLQATATAVDLGYRGVHTRASTLLASMDGG